MEVEKAMGSKVDIQGQVGVNVIAELGSSIHINVHRQQNIKLISAVGQLLQLSNKHDILMNMQDISLMLYGSKLFKSLTAEQVDSLICIANQMIAAIDRLSACPPSVVTKNPKPLWKKFFGI